jgi:hypothetical protein
MKKNYTTHGNVRGTCGHSHQNIRTAVNCQIRDSNYCRKQGGYSDRIVVVNDFDCYGNPKKLDDNEQSQRDEYLYNN